MTFLVSLRDKPLEIEDLGEIAKAPVAAECGAWTAALASLFCLCATNRERTSVMDQFDEGRYAPHG